MITQARLKHLLHYDPDTGLFTWLNPTSNRVRVGQIAGTRHSSDGRIHVRLDGKRYYASRLAWLYMTGAWPTGEVDHKDGFPGDNRWENLRDVTPGQNARNNEGRECRAPLSAHGVQWRDHANAYCARVKWDGVEYWLGYFNTQEAAIAAHQAKRKELAAGFELRGVT